MKDRLRLFREAPQSNRWRIACFQLIVVFLGLRSGVLEAASDVIKADLFGKPLTVSGYLNQGIQFGAGGDYYDTQEWFQSAIFQTLIETTYFPVREIKFFGSAYFNADWAYPILEHDNDWRDREFNKAKDDLFILDEYETLLKEFHFSWAPGNFVFRVGKQIVVWGETDGVRLMDQINPQDTRRGVSDVEFETTIIPIWLLKGEYYPGISTTWLQDFGVEFVFNPNADFISDKGFSTGNDFSGIWAPNVSAGQFYELPFSIMGYSYLPASVVSLVPDFLKPLFNQLPVYDSRVGKLTQDLDHPEDWDPDYQEFGLRAKMVIHDAIVTLNGFYGRENSPITRQDPTGVINFRQASDGVLIVEPTVEGYFPLLRFVGFTASRDIPFFRLSAIGGVAPMLRTEFLYAFNSTFVSNGKYSLAEQLAGKAEDFEQRDEIRYSVAMDFDLRIPFLNPRDSFTLTPQFVHRHIMDFPSAYAMVGVGSVPVTQDNYFGSLMLRTTYLHNKLMPIFYWQHAVTGKQVGTGSMQGDMFMMQLSYEQSDHWNYTLQAVFLEGEGMEALDHKDNVCFTVAYRF